MVQHCKDIATYRLNRPRGRFSKNYGLAMVSQELQAIDIKKLKVVKIQESGGDVGEEGGHWDQEDRGHLDQENRDDKVEYPVITFVTAYYISTVLNGTIVTSYTTLITDSNFTTVTTDTTVTSLTTDTLVTSVTTLTSLTT